MNDIQKEDVNPWYKEFWPWFIICLIGSVMIASLSTVYIAVSGADQVVSDDYYKEGLKINQNLEKDQRAIALNLSAELSINEKSISLTLSQPIEDKIVLNFIHPVEEAMDFSIILSSKDKQHFETELIQSLSGRWHLEITDQQGLWRLKTVSNNIADQKPLSFQAR